MKVSQLSLAYVFAGALLLAHCGGSSSTSSTPTPTPTPTVPTISSVTGISSGTSTSATIATTGTATISVLSTNPVTITFSTAMDTTTITTSNISLSCDGTAQTITIANSNSSTNTTFTVTPSANITQVTSCTLTIGTGVLSSDGGALASAATYVYTTGCTTNDNFAINTLSTCWTAGTEVAKASTLAISSGTLNFTIPTTSPTGTNPVIESKIFSSPSNLVATVAIPTFSGLAYDATQNCGIIIWNGSMTSPAGVQADVQSKPHGGVGGLDLNTDNIGTQDSVLTTLSATGSSNAALSGVLYLRITQSGTTFTTSASIDGGTTFTDYGSVTGVSLGSTVYVSLATSNSTTANDVSCSYDNFTVSGGAATGQDSGGL